MQRLILLCFIVLFSIVSNAQDLNRKIDSLIQSEFKEINGPGGVFLIAKKGKPIYEKAFGMANLELDSKLNTNSVFPDWFHDQTIHGNRNFDVGRTWKVKGE